MEGAGEKCRREPRLTEKAGRKLNRSGCDGEEEREGWGEKDEEKEGGERGARGEEEEEEAEEEIPKQVTQRWTLETGQGG